MSARDLGIDGFTEFVEIGRGGFATVYSATDTRFDRKVAIKVLARLDEDGRRRFEREQRSMGKMAGHAHVVIPFSSGFTVDGYPYLAMEFLAGGSLADLIDGEGPLSWERATRIILPIADALGHGHQQGVLHRDVKPENILLDEEGVAKLADFGISSIRLQTATEVRPFTLAHSPPETFDDGLDLRDERSDLYSLASTLFQAVTKRPPFSADGPSDSPAAYMVRIMNAPIPSIGSDHRYDRFMTSALAKDPSERPQSAASFIAALALTLAQSNEAEPTERVELPDLPPRRRQTMPDSNDERDPAPPPRPVSPRPGWFPAAHGPAGHERFWDGVQWHPATRPAAPGHLLPAGQPGPDNPLGPPAGWYDDPYGRPAIERQWDGARWTELTRPVETPSHR